jgi:peptidyl-Lys metalloendopeptidase
MSEKGNTTFDKIKYILTAKDTFIKDNPIAINFTLQNISNEKLWILTWYTPLEGLKGKIFQVTCEGKEVPYEGPMVKRGQPSNADYAYIEPGKSVSKEFDLSRAYQVPESQACVIAFKGRIYDYATSSNILPKRAEEQQMVDIPGNRITIRVMRNS